MREFDIVDDESCIIGKDNDIHEGIGTIHELVDIRGMVEGETKHALTRLVSCMDKWACANGKCPSCGYDRAVFETHTEAESATLKCDNCGYILAKY